jgi:ribosomal RNA-processing protein 12
MHSVLASLLTLRPNQNDAVLTPIWSKLLGIGFGRYAREAIQTDSKIHEMLAEELIDQEQAIAFQKHNDVLLPVLVGEFVNGSFTHLMGGSTSDIVIASAGKAFAAIAKSCITDGMISQAYLGTEDGAASPLGDFLAVIDAALKDIRYRDALPGILDIAGRLFERLGGDNQDLIEDILQKLVVFRDNTAYHTSFPCKSQLENALVSAIRAMGYNKFVGVVPLNVEVGEPKRPYLLSMFVKCQSSGAPFGNHDIAYFGSDLVPLSSRLFERCADLISKGHEREGKLFETLGVQVWQLFSVVCASMPGDVGEGGWNGVAETLAVILKGGAVGTPDLRPIVCAGLRSLVEGYLKLEKEKEQYDEGVQMRIESGLEAIKSTSTGFMAMLCNNYTSPDLSVIEGLVAGIKSQKKGGDLTPAGLVASARNVVLQTVHEKENQKCELAIKAFLQIANQEAIDGYFMELVKSLLQSQVEEREKVAMVVDEEPAVVLQKQIRSYAIIDLLLLLLPSIATGSIEPIQLLYQVLIGQLGDSDVTLQKRTYKAINRVFEILSTSESVNLFPLLKDLCAKLVDEDITLKTGSGAKKARIELIGRIVDCVGVSTADVVDTEGDALLLEFVPVALGEVMLATKEASEKARTSAFETLAIMAKKMLKAGGGESKLNFGEFTMMIVAGLAGSTANMQSATISCLARLLFEFRNDMEDSLIAELVTTIVCMLQSPNREVIKAGLGFIKVVVICGAAPRDQLESIVVGILKHSRSHTSHFKAKVRHVFERLIRKFGYDEVEVYVPEADRKLVVNIKKRKERAKRKKIEGKEAEKKKEDGNEEERGHQKSFEEVLASDESDLGSDGEDVAGSEDEGSKEKKSGMKTQIREDEGEDILDFLDAGIVAKVSSGNTLRYKQKAEVSGPDEFKFNAKGRLIIHDADAERKAEKMAARFKQKKDPGLSAEGGLFMEAMKSETMLERTPGGKMKFANKRKRGDDEEMEVVEEDEGDIKAASDRRLGAAKDKAMNKMLGREFRAKNARGDVKKGDVDPYAYIPLNAKVGGSRGNGGEFKGILKHAQKGSKVESKEGKKFGGGVKKGNKRHRK